MHSCMCVCCALRNGTTAAHRVRVAGMLVGSRCGTTNGRNRSASVRVTWSAEGLHVVGTSTWWVGAVRAESEYMYLYSVQSFI